MIITLCLTLHVCLFQASIAIEPEAGPSQHLFQNIDILKQQTIGSLVIQEPKGDAKQEKMLIKFKRSIRKIYRLTGQIKKLKSKSYINELAKSDVIQEILKLQISPTAALLLQEELKNYKRIKTARRWNMECKIIALRLYKRSPTCYKLLRKMICLPAPSTLKCLLGKFQFRVGVNKKIFDVIKNKALRTEKSDNEYILMWDEMSIKKNLCYNSKDDNIEGYQDHALQGRSPQIASYALVFMIAGIRKKLKQPVAFYLSAGSVTADRLNVLVKEVGMIS